MKRILLTAVLALATFLPATAAECVPGFFVVCPAVAEAPKVEVSKDFVPGYHNVKVESGWFNGAPQHISDANPKYFVTDATALVLLVKFGAERIELEDAIWNLGAHYVEQTEDGVGKRAVYRILVFKPGTILRDAHGEIFTRTRVEIRVNAGDLADEYTRAPEKDFPAQSFPGQKPFLSNAEQGAWKLLIQIHNDTERGQ